MKVLAIDPGNIESAYVVLDDSEILYKGIIPNDEALVLVSTVNQWSVAPTEAVVIEMVQSFGMAVGAEVFETVFWIGRFFQASPIPAHRIFRKDVKIHLCNSMKAKDANIRQALIDKLGIPGSKKNPGPTFGITADMWSALAVGVTWIETRGNQ